MPLPGFNRPAVGIGFRKESGEEILKNIESFDVLEVTVDHYLYGSTALREQILEVSRRAPIVAHGIGLSIGTAMAPDEAYLDAVAEFLEVSKAPWYSEHLAFTKVPGKDLAQLVPVPRTHDMVEVLAENLAVVKRHVRCPLLLENISYYFEYPISEYGELEFTERVLSAASAHLLLDVENLYINSRNHGFDPYAYLRAIPAGLVKGVHVAGGTKLGELLLDSHDSPVPDEVLSLMSSMLLRQSPDTIILERDQNFECFDEILADVQRLREGLSTSVREV